MSKRQLTEFESSIMPGMGVTEKVGSDRYPFTVIYATDDRQFVILQADNYRRIDNNGMSEDQVYEYTPNPNGAIRLLKRYYHPRTNKPYYRPYGSKAKDGYGFHFGERNAYIDPHF